MKCEHCNNDLWVSNTTLSGDQTEYIQKMVCCNRECAMYAGTDLNNPLKIAKTVRTNVE